jgi:hypothetical protein
MGPVDAIEAELVDVEDDIVGDLPALPGSRKNSEHRRLSGKWLSFFSLAWCVSNQFDKTNTDWIQ